MKLEKEDVDLYIKLHSHLLLFANERLEILKNIGSSEAIINTPIEEKIKLRDALYQQKEIITEFVEGNPFKFNPSELEIINGWLEVVQGRFYLLRYLKKYSILLCAETESKAYGVLGLRTDFDELVGPYLPVMVNAALLPFKGQIIYDGFLSSFNIYFGGGIKRRFNEAYEEAKAKYGIITSLPLGQNPIEQSDEEKLRFYLKNDSNREYYQSEIWALTRKNRSLLILYHQERGKFYARSFSKRLRELGFSNIWFAILSGMIVASEKSKLNLESLLNNIVPQDQRDLVYIFLLKN